MRASKELDNFSFIHELAYRLRVRDAMTQIVSTVSPEKSMWEARTILRDKRISGLPVVQGKKLVGIISVEDIIRALDEKEINSVVEKRMTRNVKTLDPNSTLIKALNTFQKYPYGRFPVVDREGNLLGIMTRGDILDTLLFELNMIVDEVAAKEAASMAQNYAFGKEGKQDLLDAKLRAGDFENIGLLSSQLKKQLQGMGIKPEIIRRAAIAAYEAETNIVIHSIGGTLRAWIEHGKIIIEAEDEGPGIADLEMALHPGFSTASDQVRAMGFGAGMGLPNIKMSVDQFHIDSKVGGSTRLTVEIVLKKVDTLVPLEAGR